MYVADQFRGPIVGRYEIFGSPRYARDQTPISLTWGFAVVALAWTIGLTTYRRWKRRSLAIGLILSATATGILAMFS